MCKLLLKVLVAHEINLSLSNVNILVMIYVWIGFYRTVPHHGLQVGCPPGCCVNWSWWHRQMRAMLMAKFRLLIEDINDMYVTFSSRSAK